MRMINLKLSYAPNPSPPSKILCKFIRSVRGELPLLGILDLTLWSFSLISHEVLKQSINPDLQQDYWNTMSSWAQKTLFECNDFEEDHLDRRYKSWESTRSSQMWPWPVKTTCWSQTGPNITSSAYICWEFAKEVPPVSKIQYSHQDGILASGNLLGTHYHHPSQWGL